MALDCQIGALGELADELDGVFKIIDDKIAFVQNKINAIPGLVDAELTAQIVILKAQMAEQFPQLAALSDLKLALPEEIKNIVDLAQDAVAFAGEIENLKEKYADADIDLLKDPANISNLLRDIQGDLNRLCDLVPTLVEVEVEECEPDTTDDAGNVTAGACKLVKKTELRGRGNTKIELNSRPNIDVKSLFTKQGRKAAVQDIREAVQNARITFVDEDGSGKITKSGFNTYGY
tara:strand:+ start:230 stop:931 length:702 start_codon:yes stop_codon:yes gene_type:complete